MNKTRVLAYWFYCNKDKLISTHEIISFGCDNFYNRAERTARQLREKGLISRVLDHEKPKNSKEDFYRVNVEEMESYLRGK